MHLASLEEIRGLQMLIVMRLCIKHTYIHKYICQIENIIENIIATMCILKYSCAYTYIP